MLDSFGRDVDYLRVSLTDRCNLRCIYCMPEAGIAKVDHNEILRFEEVLQVVRAFASLGGRKIRYTGGEPLILKGIEKLIAGTAKISSVQDIAITTNGTFLYDMATNLKQAGLKRVNISLDTLEPDKYSRITRGGNINKVFQSIEKCLSIGLNPIKINTVLIKGINDDELKDFIELTRNYPVDVRFIELMPLGEGKKYFQEGKMSTQEVLDRFPALLPVLSDYKSTAQMYKLKGAKGRVGFISPLSCKFCASCNRLRLTSTGTLKACLHSKEEVSIKEHLGNQIALAGILKSTILVKPQEHLLDSEGISKSAKMMFQIGG